MCLLMLALGVFVGIIFGSIPGLTATLGVTLFIPFTYTLAAVQGLTLLIAVYVGGISGGLITATSSISPVRRPLSIPALTAIP